MLEENATLPPVYVDPAILSRGPLTEASKFLVNAEEFVELTASDSPVQFEVYQMDNDGDMYCSTPSESESEFGDNHHAELRVTLQKVPNGYIVNGNCYLTTNQWNTLVTPAVSVKLLHCVVCGVYCELDVSGDHVTTEQHTAALSACPPLDKFELSIVRKIRNIYHCAVCNEIFDVSEETNHFDSKMHAGNSLFSINKASDLLYTSLDHSTNSDKSVYDKDTYHFKTHAMDSPSNDSESVSSEQYYDNFNFINFQDNYYEEEEPPAFTGLSYATMAKKPKVNTQSYVDVDLGNKTVKIRYESWNMIIKPNSKENRFWCMVCKKYDHMRNKTEHCNEPQHIHNLTKCRVVEQYEEHFIRRVDDKLYHCGHCNNLQMVHEMADHVETVHPRKKSTDNKIIKNLDNKPADNNSNIDTNNALNIAKSINNTPISSPIKLPIAKKLELPSNNSSPIKNLNNNNYVNINIDHKPNSVNHNGNSNNGLNHVLPGIFDSMVIYPFGSRINVPLLAYNICCKRPGDFYCGLCDVVCMETAIARHVYEVKHLELLQRTPFIAPFNNNLIRAVREALHCTICNMPIPALKIYEHIEEPPHVDARNKALNINPAPKLPPIGVKIPNVPETLPVNRIPGPTGVTPKSPVHSNASVANNNIMSPNRLNAINKDIVKPKTDEIAAKNTEIKIPVDVYKNNERYNDINTKPVNDEELDIEIDDIDDDDDEAHQYFEETDEELEKTFESLASEDATFDEEEHVYLKLKNSYIKISNTSYNTLVHVGDGSRYCFVCAIQVEFFELQRHVDGRSHLENMDKYMFLDKYEDHLLRQIYLMYHCAICNVIVTRKELKTHLEWPTHALQNVTLKNIKKTRKTEIKGGVKQVVVSTQKENIYLHENEPKIKICLNAQICDKSSRKDSVDLTPKVGFSRKNKIIIFNDNVLKLPWESWHGITKVKSGVKCVVCQRDVAAGEADAHCSGEWHRYGLDRPLLTQHAPALLRKINESTLNCLICNTEISNKDHLIQIHVSGKKHVKNYEDILKDSSMANTYTDCNDDVLML